MARAHNGRAYATNANAHVIGQLPPPPITAPRAVAFHTPFPNPKKGKKKRKRHLLQATHPRRRERRVCVCERESVCAPPSASPPPSLTSPNFSPRPLASARS
eukprot:TRINITY_DN11671_c0_g1_i1.p2 TRINITY_DN11671_c0_g1~~TRINITY_DN11671_c0_g1_i1.p2  ORF type:complete len:102 (-),score=14.73 TRINITY_DN11671_c0_g1_i1:1028-1333(-)